MSHTVLVTPQIPVAYVNGGIGTFVGHFSRLLREHNEHVTLLFTEPPQTPASLWRPYFQKQGIDVISLTDKMGEPLPRCPRFIHIADQVVKLMPRDATVVYFADWRANGFTFNRINRYRDPKLPVTVTVLHGCSEWHRQGQRLYPSSYEELIDDFAERYVAQTSDFVVAPSQYALDWAAANSWTLPPRPRQRALGYPFFPAVRPPHDNPSECFRRVVFYGRIETRKGFDIFVKALLAQPPQLVQSLHEIVLLGSHGVHMYGSTQVAADLLHSTLNVPVLIKDTLDSQDAQQYLADHASDTLVVIPSRAETMGFTVIETSTIPGLNGIYSNAGGIPEVFGADHRETLCEPTPRDLAQKIEAALTRGPRPQNELPVYDWNAANARWWEFHQEVSVYGQRRQYKPASADSQPRPLKAVDVVVPYYNLPDFLPAALESLAAQTWRNFKVYVVNDGSTDPRAIEVFEALKARYSGRGWVFATKPNEGVCIARNYGAALGKGDYLCFVDADNIAAPEMLEVYVKSIEHSQDDCLTCSLYAFEGDDSPFLDLGNMTNAKILVKPAYVYIPPGDYLVAGMLENVHGDVNCIVRRSVFEALGGFTMDHCRELGHEDRHFFTRLALVGYKIDAVPEYLLFYRHRENSRLREIDLYDSETRILRLYEERLKAVGLEDVAPLVMGLSYHLRDALYRLGLPPVNNDTLDHFINHVRWYTLLNALRGKVMKNIRKLHPRNIRARLRGQTP